MKSTLTNLARSNIRKDKSSSILIIFSIFVTTVLLSVIATWGYGLVNNNHINSGALYGEYYGYYRRAANENIKEMKLRSEFTDIGKTAVLGIGQSEINTSFLFSDETVRKMLFIDGQFTRGGYPKEKNEIAGCPSLFRQFGLEDPKIGDKAEITFRTGDDAAYQTDTFVISGLMEEYDNGGASDLYNGYVTEAYYESKVPESEQMYNVLFNLDKSLGITAENAENYIKELGEKCGIDIKYAGDNYNYLMWELDPGTETIIYCVLISFVVVIFSVVVIYNIFHVGIVRKVQEYGKLKAIGATRKQMKQVIWKEGMTLASIAVPAGTLVGYVIGVAGFRIMMNFGQVPGFGAEMKRVPLFSPPLLILVAAVSIVTVWIALRKPMKIVASISPVEAMRYQESTGNGKGIRKGHKEIGILGMTAASLLQNRRRTVSTMVSMGMSGILFFAIASFMGNMDAEYDARRTVEHGQIEVFLDVAMDDKAYPENNLNEVLKNNPFDPKIMEQIKNIPGVTDVKTQNILYGEYADKNGKTTGKKYKIAVFDREDFDAAKNDSFVLGEFDYDSTSRQDGIIYGWGVFMEEEGFSLGQDIYMQLADGKERCFQKSTLMGSFGSISGDFAITEDTYQKLELQGNMTSTAWIDCEQKDVDGIASEINNIFVGNKHVDIDTYENQLNISKKGMQVLKISFYSFAVMIGIISFFNMVNTIITSIAARKQEFGVLQAIGMTNRQLNKSLQLEGIIFTAGTVLISAAVGSPLGYMIFCSGKENGWIGLNNYHFPWLEVLLMMGSIAVMQIIVSFLLSRNVKKESLVERIRYQE